MSGHFSLYDKSTGLFTGAQVHGPDHLVAMNTPIGCAVLRGQHDHLSRCVDLATGNVIDYIPPAPADDHMFTWAWAADIKRWGRVKTLAAHRADLWTQIKAARDAAIRGGVTWDGSTFDSDATSQANIQGAAQLAMLALVTGEPIAIDWTLQDNTVRTLSGADLRALGQALGAHIGEQHATARALRAAIEAATADDLETITCP